MLVVKLKIFTKEVRCHILHIIYMYVSFMWSTHCEFHYSYATSIVSMRVTALPRKIRPPFSGSLPQKNAKLLVLKLKLAAPQNMGKPLCTFLKYLDTEINTTMLDHLWKSVCNKTIGRLFCLHFYWQETKLWSAIKCQCATFNIVKHMATNTSLQNMIDCQPVKIWVCTMSI